MLDQNHLMGGSILDAALHTLLYAPSTATVASANSESSHNIIYSYSLWRLEPHVRRNWLMSVEVIMYKVVLVFFDDFTQDYCTQMHDDLSIEFAIIIDFISTDAISPLQYEYTQPSYSQNVHHLVRIILNSLEAQFHRCKRIPATVVMEMPSRSRGIFVHNSHFHFNYINKFSPNRYEPTIVEWYG